MNKDWIDSPRGRKEAITFFASAAVILLVSMIAGELYPFSAPSMFAVEVDSVCEYWVQAPDGDWLSVELFGLQLNNPHDPPVRSWGRQGYGRKSPHSLNQYSSIATKQEVVKHVREKLARFPELEFVNCTQRVVQLRDDGSVGVVKENVWRITNPLFNPELARTEE